MGLTKRDGWKGESVAPTCDEYENIFKCGDLSLKSLTDLLYSYKQR